MYGIALIALAVVALWLLRFFWLLAGRRPHPHPLRLGEEAATVLEFTLVFPLFLMILLIIWQLLLLVNATQVVSYAAFSAARSAIVVIPQEVGGEGRNMLAAPDSSEKMALIRRAAVVACTPISPPITEWSGAYGSLAGGASVPGSLDGFRETAVLTALAAAAGLNGPRIALKASYAAQFTDVDVSGPRWGGAFAEDAPLTVTVTHKFFLNVPYANRLFSDQFFAGFGSGSHQRTLTAQYTLANEGAREVP